MIGTTNGTNGINDIINGEKSTCYFGKFKVIQWRLDIYEKI